MRKLTRNHPRVSRLCSPAPSPKLAPSHAGKLLVGQFRSQSGEATRLRLPSLKIVLAGEPAEWVPLVGAQVQGLTRRTEVALDMRRVQRLDLDELAALARLLENLKASGHTMVLRNLQPDPLSLLVRLGLIQQLGAGRRPWPERRRRVHI